MSERDPDTKATVPAEDEPSGRPARAEPAAAAPPGRIGPYRLQQKLGAGGMGEVWAAEQRQPVRRRVALKLIRWGMDSEEVLARFESERQALALMNHPNIAAIYDAGVSEQGRPYFVMEYVDGEAITDYCDRHRLDLRRRLELFRQVCDGVQHAHQRGIIHRDLKPSNVLVKVQDGQPVPKIIDFGVSKATAQRLTERTVFTELGQLIGTPEYMSPEQAEMTGLDVDTRTDVYSLGALLYELAVGVPPLDGSDLRRAGFAELQRRIREEEPLRPSTRLRTASERSTLAQRRRAEPKALVRRLHGDLDWIVMKALDKDRTRRYDTVSEMGADLARHLRHEPVTAGPPSTLYRAKKFLRRHRAGVAAAALVVLALVAGTIGTTVGLIRARQAERLARAEAEATRQVSDFLVELFEISDPSEARGNTVTAREILDRGTRQIRDSLTDQMPVRTRLLDTMGTVYRSLGLYGEAGDLFEEALEQRLAELGESHPEVARSLTLLGTARWEAGDYEAAESLLGRALAAGERALGPEHLEVAATLYRLGVLYDTLGRYDEAESAARRALEIRERELGPEHAEVARTLNSLGILSLNRARFADAESFLERALAIKEATLDPGHPSLANALNNLGIVHMRRGEPERAAPLYERALAIREMTLGADHPDVAGSLNNLGIVYRRAGDAARAEDCFRRALEIWERSLGPDHADVAIALGNLASATYDRGAHAESERQFRRAVAIFEQRLEPEHPFLAANLSGLAAVLREQGRFTESEALYARALAIQEKVLAPGAGELADTRDGYALLLERLGRTEEARDLRARAAASRAGAGAGGEAR